MRLNRSRRSRDIWLDEKMIFFAIGAALGLGGMITGHDWLVWPAIVVLLVGFVLRLLGRRGRGDADTGPEADDADTVAERDSDWASDWEAQDEDRDTVDDDEGRGRSR